MYLNTMFKVQEAQLTQISYLSQSAREYFCHLVEAFDCRYMQILSGAGGVVVSMGAYQNFAGSRSATVGSTNTC